MTFRGRVKNGVVVLEDSARLPEGTVVNVRPVTTKRRTVNGKKRRPTVGKALLKLAGKAKGLPADAARNVDHYLYGHPKR